jgi:Uma2 family endonuclease
MTVDLTNLVPSEAGDLAIATPIDLANRFGDIPLWRIAFDPPPGRATERDCVAANERSERLCELVDGTLIEKVMGSFESLIAGRILTLWNSWIDAQPRKPGLALSADGMLRLRANLIRVPDACYIARERLRGGTFPRHGIAALAPTIAVEVISEGNTPREMDEKLNDYFQSGTQEAWYVYPDARLIRRYNSPTAWEDFHLGDTLSTPLMPGMICPVAPLLVHPDEEFADEEEA